MQTQILIQGADLSQYLCGAHYPMSKGHIVEFVRQRRGSFGLIRELKQLPEGLYFGVLDIQEELMEKRGEENE